MTPAPLPVRYEVESAPNPADGGMSGLYRVTAYHRDGTIEALYEGSGWEGREWAYTLAGRLQREQQPAPLPTPRERADLLRKVYRYFRLYGRVTATDVLMYDGAIEELRKLGWRLNADESDWLPPEDVNRE